MQWANSLHNQFIVIYRNFIRNIGASSCKSILWTPHYKMNYWFIRYFLIDYYIITSEANT